jgi:ATP-dependent Clp protease ATP-binding subunit ClpC
MFGRYTEKAKRAIFFARYECGQLGSHSIESEHLLLGILSENKALYLFPTSHDAIASLREEIDQRANVGQKISTSVDHPLSAECTRILAYAAEEADRLSHQFIGSEHLLLGVLRERKCFAASLLHERGVSLDTARTQIGEISRLQSKARLKGE